MIVPKTLWHLNCLQQKAWNLSSTIRMWLFPRDNFRLSEQNLQLTSLRKCFNDEQRQKNGYPEFSFLTQQRPLSNGQEWAKIGLVCPAFSMVKCIYPIREKNRIWRTNWNYTLLKCFPLLWKTANWVYYYSLLQTQLWKSYSSNI